MKITVLGTGTSTGVPVAGCKCSVCSSLNDKNKRLRTSVYIETESMPSRGLLIDTSTDFRAQALRASLSRIDSVFYTHTHADHIFGIDDLRSYNFIQKTVIPVYASKASAEELKRLFHYAFFSDPTYEGGAPPKLELHPIDPYVPVNIFGLEITPLPVLHGRMEVFGYRIGKFAYLTDCSHIPEATRELLSGLDILILDGLRIRAHPTHFTLAQAVNEVEQIKPKSTYLTHISHELDHEVGNQTLSELTELSVQLAYDGLVLSC